MTNGASDVGNVPKPVPSGPTTPQENKAFKPLPEEVTSKIQPNSPFKRTIKAKAEPADASVAQTTSQIQSDTIPAKKTIQYEQLPPNQYGKFPVRKGVNQEKLQRPAFKRTTKETDFKVVDARTKFLRSLPDDLKKTSKSDLLKTASFVALNADASEAKIYHQELATRVNKSIDPFFKNSATKLMKELEKRIE